MGYFADEIRKAGSAEAVGKQHFVPELTVGGIILNSFLNIFYNYFLSGSPLRIEQVFSTLL